MDKLVSRAIKLLVIMALIILIISLVTDFWSKHR